MKNETISNNEMATTCFETIKHETVKAVLLTFDFDSNRNPAKFWMPKSQIEIDSDEHTITAPVWLWLAKIKDNNLPCIGVTFSDGMCGMLN